MNIIMFLGVYVPFSEHEILDLSFDSVRQIDILIKRHCMKK